MDTDDLHAEALRLSMLRRALARLELCQRAGHDAPLYAMAALLDDQARTLLRGLLDQRPKP